MTSSNTGSAREIAPGRLAHFEDSEERDDPTARVSPLLPPRRPRLTRPEKPEKKEPKVGRQASGERKPVPAKDPSLEPADEQGLPPALSVPHKALKGPEDRVRPSNVHIPVALLEPIEAKCKAEGLSHGEVIIVVIESTLDRLKDLIHPAATSGGALFASRRSRASRSADGPLTPLNYRLREADFEVLDQLVEDLGASSRGHLITAALNDYFRI